MEYDYARCAVQCGIDMTETRLFPSEKCPGYFGIKRFDCTDDGGRVHMQTAAALLELDFNQPSLDYHSLMKLTKILTHGNVHDMENLGEVWVGYDGEPKSTQFGRKSLRLARPLEPGFVLTIEPGIYFIPELIDLWKSEGRFKDFINYDKVGTYKDFSGLRNEEDYLITETGARRLGKKIPLTAEEVEALR